MEFNESKMLRIEVFGKDRLGDVGFCLNTQKLIDHPEAFGRNFRLIDYESQFDNYSGNFIMTSMTSMADIEEYGGDYIPNIVRLRLLTTVEAFNAEVLMDSKKRGISAPTADFIAWNRYDNEKLRVATFSKSAPVLYFEASNGMCCLGTVLRKPILNRGTYIFKKVVSEFMAYCIEDTPPDIICRVVTCTNYKYPEGTIFENIQKICADVGISDVKLMYAVDENKDWLYQYNEYGNHVVVVGGKR